MDLPPVAALVGRKAVIAKLGMDAHWRGAIVVAHALRDAGMEVVYLGHGTGEEIAIAVQQEGAELLGLSSLSGNHLDECAAITKCVREVSRGCVIVAGGTIPPRDEPALLEMGVDACFGVGASLQEIRTRIAELIEARA